MEKSVELIYNEIKEIWIEATFDYDVVSSSLPNEVIAKIDLLFDMIDKIQKK